MGNALPPPLGAALLLHATGSPSSGLRIRSFGGDEATTRLKNDDGFTTLDLASPALEDGWITHLAMGEASLERGLSHPLSTTPTAWSSPAVETSVAASGPSTSSFTDTRNKTCYCKWMHWCLPIYRY